jgi:PAS domain S-box-containing protein
VAAVAEAGEQRARLSEISADSLALLLDAAPVGMLLWQLVDPADDTSLVLAGSNMAAGRLLQRDLAPEMGKRLLDAFPQATPDRCALWASLARRGAEYKAVVESNVGGVDLPFELNAIGFGGDRVAIFISAIDEQRRTLIAAVEATAFVASIVESIPHMVFVKDANELRFERFNKAGEALLGVTRDQLIGKNDHDFFPAEQAEAFIAADRETLRGGAPVDIPEEPIQTPTGTRWLHTKKVPIHDWLGQPKYLLGISEDITERREQEAALRAAKDAAEASNRELETFSYSVAHDLRAPLRAIDGYGQALVEDHGASLDAAAHGFLDRIRGNAKRMSRLIDDLLQLARVSRAEPLRVPVDLTAVAAEAAERAAQAEPGRRVHVVIAPGVDAVGDPGLLRVALDNLVGNAFKFTRGSGGRVEFGADAAGASVRYFVRDDGVGFDIEHAGKLFRPFERLHAGDFEGTGIGLAIVRRVVERHGGRVWAESAPGQGATFSFTLGPDR